jgi:hypothetical protein
VGAPPGPGRLRHPPEQGFFWFSRPKSELGRITLKVQRHGRSVTVTVTADGDDRIVSHAGAALLAACADRLGLRRALSERLAGLRRRRGGHDPGRVVRDLAVTLADGGDALCDLRARLTHSARRWTLHVPARWPWQRSFIEALTRIRALPAAA